MNVSQQLDLVMANIFRQVTKGFWQNFLTILKSFTKIIKIDE